MTVLNVMAWAHPLVREWFVETFKSPSPPQVQGWAAIVNQQSTLISAPTGSGKTLAAFLVCIDQLVRQSLAGTLNKETQILYISPLKALTNDIQKNLLGPLAQIQALAKQQGLAFTSIEVMVRTGDTIARDRQSMLKNPPSIIVSTPESLYLLLTAEKSRALLRTVHTVIVDEIHALAPNKRGSHLALSLERLEVLAQKPLLRIGLSATQKPLERVAQFLVGERPLPTIIDIGYKRSLELTVEVPADELSAVASNELWDGLYDRLVELSGQYRTILVFVNTRRLAERLAHRLSSRLAEGLVAAHHGSLARKLRLAAEQQLKQGTLKILVATASLELGIDIGHVDLVCQIGSPRSISTALQRVGRAGHWHEGIARGKFLVTTRDELMECAAIIQAIKDQELDELHIPLQPLDILAQQLVASCAVEDWQEDELYAMVKRCFPYRDLSYTLFNEVVLMLTEGIASSRGRYGSHLLRDAVHKRLTGRRGSRLLALTNGGAIPENAMYTVIAEPQGMTVGTLDEDFAVDSHKGDIILLGNTSWQIIRVDNAHGRVLVCDAHGAPPTVPFWQGEAPGRSDLLSSYVGRLRESIHQALPMGINVDNYESLQDDTKPCCSWLSQQCGVDKAGAEQLIDYILQGRAVLGTIPTQTRIIAERFFDEGGGMQLIIHAPFGARINKAWGLALRKRFCRSFNFELQAAATDNGISISLTEQHSFPLADVFQFLHPNSLKEVLIQALLQSPLFATRWRWDATRALMLKRFSWGRKTPPLILRMQADDLLAAVFPDAKACQDNVDVANITLPSHPLVSEAMNDVLNEALDLQGLLSILQQIMDKTITCLAMDTPVPSAFSHEILNANPYAYLDDAPLEERRARAVEMRRILPQSLQFEMGRLDSDMIKEVQNQQWPDVRNADELHDFLQTVLALPIHHALIENKINPSWLHFWNELLYSQRGGEALFQEQVFWVTTEKKSLFLSIYPQAAFQQNLPHLNEEEYSQDEAIRRVVQGWLNFLSPISAQQLSGFLRLEEQMIFPCLLGLESAGSILRGQFTNASLGILEWCERRILARLHQRTLTRLRRQIKPVSSAQYMNWLCRWQHLYPGTQLQGEQGLLQVLKQLQGYEIPANAWEKQIFAKRIQHYHASMLDKLCLSGIVGWGRLSPHPALQSSEQDPKRINPSSIVPISFFLRQDNTCFPAPEAIDLTRLSHVAQDIHQFLNSHGAAFLQDIIDGVHHLKSEVETALWELVAGGAITADGFDNLRGLIDPKRRLRKKHTPAMGGRWTLLKRKPISSTNAAHEALCWLLLQRYGVCFRELLTREKMMPSWRELVQAFRRLELRGEIRGGRFVDGYNGEQFALPYAVDSLRALRKEEEDSAIITVSAADPLNLVGIILPGERVNAQTHTLVHFQNGERAL